MTVPNADRVRRAMAHVTAQMPWFRGKGRIVRALDRLVTDDSDADSYIAETTINGDLRMRLDMRVLTQLFAYYYGGLERELVAMGRQLYRPGLAIDIGGSIGLWAVALGLEAQKRGGRVVTCEPVPHHVARLRENLALNGLQALVEVHPIALGAEQGTVSLRAGSADIADNAVITTEGEVHATAPLERLDDYAAEHGWRDVTFIKIDTEGYDPHVIAGGAELIRRDRPVIVAELLRSRLATYGSTMDSVWELLVRELGYHCYRVERGRLVELGAPGDHENLFFLPSGVAPPT